MNTYMIFSFDIADQEHFAPYGKAVVPILMKYQAEILAIDFNAQKLEGDGRGVNVIIKFPSEEYALAFYNDPDYTPWKALRMTTTINNTAVLAKEFVHPA
jgi:uncharacterized protein (DUF1330 family)